MKCPGCQYVNPTMTARCMQCRTTLEHEGVGHSDLYREAVRAGDTRVFSGIGAVVGGVLATLGTSIVNEVSLDELWHYGNLRLIVMGGVLAGGLLGRLAAWRKNRWL